MIVCSPGQNLPQVCVRRSCVSDMTRLSPLVPGVHLIMTRRHKKPPVSFFKAGIVMTPDAFLPQFEVKPVEFFSLLRALWRAGAVARGCL